MPVEFLWQSAGAALAEKALDGGVGELDNSSMDDIIIGRRQFTDGVTREVYLDEGGQYVLDGANEKVYGIWLLTDDVPEDVPPRDQLPDLPVIVNRVDSATDPR